MNKRKLVFGIGIAAILVCGLSGFFLLSDPASGDPLEFLDKMGPTRTRSTVFTFGSDGNYGQAYTFDRSLEEMYTLLRDELVKRRGWKENNPGPPYNFLNPRELDEIVSLNMELGVQRKDSKISNIVYWRKATKLQIYKKKFMVAIGADKNELITGNYY